MIHGDPTWRNGKMKKMENRKPRKKMMKKKKGEILNEY